MKLTTENKLIYMISLIGVVAAVVSLIMYAQSSNDEQLFIKDSLKQSLERNNKISEDQDQVVQDDESTQDEQWKQQQIRYNFTCMHKQMGKNYEALVINNPGTPTAPSGSSPSHFILENHPKDGNNRFSQSTQTKKQLPKHNNNQREEQHKQQTTSKLIEDLNEVDDLEIFQDLDAASNQIKISLDYSGMIQKQENKQKINYIQQRLLPEVITKIIEMISVKKDKIPGPPTSEVNGNPNNVKSVVIPYGQCYRTKVPTLHSTTGIDTDLILYVTNIKEGNNKIWGVVCVRDFGQNYRPVAAQLNIDEELVLEENHGFNVKALTHELVHILGFSERSLSLSKNNKDIFILDDNNKKMLNLNVLKNYAQTYYNCSQKITGLPLEGSNQSQNGTSSLSKYFSQSGSSPESANTQEIHFEKTLLMNDLMTAEIMSNSQLSPLSLKVLESTGWYDVKLEHALNFHFLLNAGCLPLLNFTSFYEQATNKTTNGTNKNSTNVSPAKNSTTPTTNLTLLENPSLRQQPHNQYLSKHIRQNNESFSQPLMEDSNSDSDLTKNKKLLPKYNKYNNGLLGYCEESEFNQIARGCSYDFCFKSVCKPSQYSNNLSFLQPMESGTCLEKVDSASNSATNSTTTGEKFSKQSYCFISDLSSPNSHEKQNTLVETARCYQAECDSVLQFVTISVFDKTIQCLQDFQIITNPSGLIGEFHCPNITDFCLAFDLRKYRFKNQETSQPLAL